MPLRAPGEAAMIVGVGIDAVSISRIAGLIDRYGQRFLSKVFTEDEIAGGRGRRDGAQYFAARFAAKEAFFKALGTGWGRGISLKEVSVRREESGRPSLLLSGRALEAAKSRGAETSHVSLSHEAGTAQAIVILEGGR
jgi:holo-[acyl-carrier protein] synthase